MTHPGLEVRRGQVAQVAVHDLTPPRRAAVEVDHEQIAVFRGLEELFLVGELHIAAVAVEQILLLGGLGGLAALRRRKKA